MQPVQIANILFSSLAIIAQVSIVVLLFSLYIRNNFTEKIISFLGNYALLFGFLIALTGTLGSLFYSEILGYTPCKLCWYQRILLYPQVMLLGMAYWRKDKNIAVYSLVLSGMGIVLAMYHYLLQRNIVEEILPCSAVGYSVSCAKTFVMTFGYITIPFMALSAFALIFLLMFVQKNANQRLIIKKQ